MAFAAEAESPPIREEEDGALRIGNSRVLLEIVMRSFQDGATPEAIVQRYSTLELADVYAVIAYYLRHRSDVESYLARREQTAVKVRQEIESAQGDLGDLAEIRERIAKRQARG